MIHPFVCLAACALLAGAGPARAEPAGSLAEARLGVIKGTSTGIVLLSGPKAARAAASAASGAGAPLANGSASAADPRSPAGGPTPAAPPAVESVADRAGELLRMAPPVGLPLNAARRMDAPTQGIALPTAAAASQATGSTRPKTGG